GWNTVSLVGARSPDCAPVGAPVGARSPDPRWGTVSRPCPSNPSLPPPPRPSRPVIGARPPRRVLRMASKSIDRKAFLSYLRQSGLLTDEQMKRAEGQLPETNRGRLVARAL